MKTIRKAAAVMPVLGMVAVAGAVFLFFPTGGGVGAGTPEAVGQSASAAVREENAVPVRVATVLRGGVRETIAQTGTLTSVRSMDIYAARGGIVKKLEVEEGSLVKPGKVLLRLEDSELALEQERSRIKLEREQREWDRQKTISEQSLSERREYREARFDYEMKKNALERLTNERQRQEKEAARVDLSFESQLASEKERDDARYQVAQANFQEARARVEFTRAEEDWNRVRSLQAHSLIDEDAYFSAKFAFEQARADYKVARLKKEQSAVRASQTGVVARLEVREGDYITQNTRLATLEDLNALETVVYLPEARWGSIRPGLPVRVLPQALPGVSVPATLVRKSPTIDPKNGTFKVTIALEPQKEGEVRPGMFVALQIQTAQRSDSLLVPLQAVIGEGSGRFLYVVDNRKAERREVKTGAAEGEQIEILAGLKEGERVVTVGQFGLKPGSSVQVMTGGPGRQDGGRSDAGRSDVGP